MASEAVYTEILQEKNYLVERKRLLRVRAGIKKNDSRVPWSCFWAYVGTLCGRSKDLELHSPDLAQEPKFTFIHLGTSKKKNSNITEHEVLALGDVHEL